MFIDFSASFVSQYISLCIYIQYYIN